MYFIFLQAYDEFERFDLRLMFLLTAKCEELRTVANQKLRLFTVFCILENAHAATSNFKDSKKSKLFNVSV